MREQRVRKPISRHGRRRCPPKQPGYSEANEESTVKLRAARAVSTPGLHTRNEKDQRQGRRDHATFHTLLSEQHLRRASWLTGVGECTCSSSTSWSAFSCSSSSLLLLPLLLLQRLLAFRHKIREERCVEESRPSASGAARTGVATDGTPGSGHGGATDDPEPWAPARCRALSMLAVFCPRRASCCTSPT